MRKIAINRPFNFFSAIIEIVRELVISDMHNKFIVLTSKYYRRRQRQRRRRRTPIAI